MSLPFHPCTIDWYNQTLFITRDQSALCKTSVCSFLWTKDSMRSQSIGKENEPHWWFIDVHLVAPPPFLVLPTAGSWSRCGRWASSSTPPCFGRGGRSSALGRGWGQTGLSSDSPSPCAVCRPSPGCVASAFHSNLMIMIFAEDDLCLHSVITAPCFLWSGLLEIDGP